MPPSMGAGRGGRSVGRATRAFAGVSFVLAFGLAVALSGGCYHYRVGARGDAGANPSTYAKTETLHSFLWGLLQDHSLDAVCAAEDESLSSVRTTTNLGFALVTVITLGIYAPARVEYRCANQVPETGIIGADASQER